MLRAVDDHGDEVEEFLKGLPRAFRKCRRFGHQWDEENDDEFVRQGAGEWETWTSTVKCLRCTNRRVYTYKYLEREDRFVKIASDYPDAKNLGYYAEGFSVSHQDVLAYSIRSSAKPKRRSRRRAG